MAETAADMFFLLASFLIFWPFAECLVEEQFLTLQLTMHQISGGPSNDQFLFLQFPVYVCCRQGPVPKWNKTCVGVIMSCEECWNS